MSRSSAKAEYKVMTRTCKMMWLKTLLWELEFRKGPMPIYCDNQTAIYIANNPIFHERTKHIEVDCHFVCDVVSLKLISTLFILFSEELTNMFTKPVSLRVFLYLRNKLGKIDHMLQLEREC